MTYEYFSLATNNTAGKTSWVPITSIYPDFVADNFTWHSTETHGSASSQYLDSVEIHYNKYDKNQYAEIAANQAKTSIYQTISTTPGSLYKWRISHASFYSQKNDILNVIINNEVQEAWRTSENGCGDKVGYVGTNISTKVSRSWRANASTQFETYEGVWECPSNITVATFAFNNVDSYSYAGGNFVDNISFAIADPLYYDLNGGTGNLPMPQPSGTYPGYHQRGTVQTLSDVIPTREGYTFIGWTSQKHPDITSALQLEAITTITSKNIEAGSNYVYALWAKNPTISFKDPIANEIISSTTIPFNTLLPESSIPSIPDHPGYVFKGFSLPTNSAFSTDTEIELIYEPTAVINVNVKWVDRDNACNIRPNIDIDIADQTDPSKTMPVHLPSSESSKSTAFNPDEFDPTRQLVLPDLSPYTIVQTAVSETVIEGILTITYELRAEYIPVVDIKLNKNWDDMNNVYKERPSNITVDIYKYNPDAAPADTETPIDDMASWELYDTVEITSAQDDENTWTATVPNIQLWTGTGHDKDTMIDAVYKVVERDVYGYDMISITGSVEEGGFTITNRIWKHIDMPTTGKSPILAILAISMGAILTAISLKAMYRRHPIRPRRKR